MSWAPIDRTGETWRDDDGVVFLVTGPAERVRGTGLEQHPVILLSEEGQLVYVVETVFSGFERVA